MANHDPISDMLTRIRNASEKRLEKTISEFNGEIEEAFSMLKKKTEDG